MIQINSWSKIYVKLLDLELLKNYITLVDRAKTIRNSIKMGF